MPKRYPHKIVTLPRLGNRLCLKCGMDERWLTGDNAECFLRDVPGEDRPRHRRSFESGARLTEIR